MKKKSEEEYDSETTESETDEASGEKNYVMINRNVKSKMRNNEHYYSDVTESEKDSVMKTQNIKSTFR